MVASAERHVDVFVHWACEGDLVMREMTMKEWVFFLERRSTGSFTALRIHSVGEGEIIRTLNQNFS